MAERESLYLHLGQVLILDSLVFASHEGKLLGPLVLSHKFQRIVRKAGLEKVRFHDSSRNTIKYIS
ncbi:hypothetical protein ACFLUQ_00195 [Chloroflexota bacterium]